MKDLIERQAAIDAVDFGITFAKVIDKSTGKVRGLFQEGNRSLDEAIKRIKNLPTAEPDEEKISDILYNIYRNTSPHTSAEGVAATKYYIREIYREIYGEEGPGWMR